MWNSICHTNKQRQFFGSLWQQTFVSCPRHTRAVLFRRLDGCCCIWLGSTRLEGTWLDVAVLSWALLVLVWLHVWSHFISQDKSDDQAWCQWGSVPCLEVWHCQVPWQRVWIYKPLPKRKRNNWNSNLINGITWKFLGIDTLHPLLQT